MLLIFINVHASFGEYHVLCPTCLLISLLVLLTFTLTTNLYKINNMFSLVLRIPIWILKYIH